MFANDRILAVDDNVANLQILEELLGEAFTLKCVTSGVEALQVAPTFRPGIVLLDVMMPVMDGNDTCRELLARPDTAETKVLMLSARSDVDDRLKAYQVGAVDYIAKPFDDREVGAKIRAWSQVVQRQQVDQMWRDVMKFGEGIGVTLASIAALRENESGQHLCRIRAYAQLLAENLAESGPYSTRIDETFLRDLHCAAPLHDIGKIGLPDAILSKPGRYEPEEIAIMRQHTVIGAALLAQSAATMPFAEYLHMAVKVARHHHERFNGKGYPDGLAGEAIPLAARIVSVADVFDAITSNRVYRKALSPAEAAAQIQWGAGTQFDPVIVQAFDSVFDRLLEARASFADPGQS